MGEGANRASREGDDQKRGAEKRGANRARRECEGSTGQGGRETGPTGGGVMVRGPTAKGGQQGQGNQREWKVDREKGMGGRRERGSNTESKDEEV